MVLKNACIAIVSLTLLACSGPSMAADDRADGFLWLDLSKAVLSPKPLGPATRFALVPVQARTDPGSEDVQAQAPAEPKAAAKPGAHRTRVARLGAAKPRGLVTALLARRHRNPLDAQAFDARIQVWPCKSGGICHWRRASQQ